MPFKIRSLAQKEKPYLRFDYNLPHSQGLTALDRSLII